MQHCQFVSHSVLWVSNADDTDINFKFMGEDAQLHNCILCYRRSRYIRHEVWFHIQHSQYAPNSRFHNKLLDKLFVIGRLSYKLMPYNPTKCCLEWLLGVLNGCRGGRARFQRRATCKDTILTLVDSGQKLGFSIHVESQFQNGYIKCNTINYSFIYRMQQTK